VLHELVARHAQTMFLAAEARDDDDADAPPVRPVTEYSSM
jgi:hypothetical protein